MGSSSESVELFELFAILCGESSWKNSRNAGWLLVFSSTEPLNQCRYFSSFYFTNWICIDIAIFFDISCPRGATSRSSFISFVFSGQGLFCTGFIFFLYRSIIFAKSVAALLFCSRILRILFLANGQLDIVLRAGKKIICCGGPRYPISKLLWKLLSILFLLSMADCCSLFLTFSFCIYNESFCSSAAGRQRYLVMNCSSQSRLDPLQAIIASLNSLTADCHESRYSKPSLSLMTTRWHLTLWKSAPRYTHLDLE